MFDVKKGKKIFLVVITVILLASVSSIGVAKAFSGAIYTSDISCLGVNVNQFADKADVYLDGGPVGGGPGVPDGEYYVKVTEPDGTLLGTSIGSADDTPAVVSGGEFAVCYRLIEILVKASDALPGFDDTTNGGGVYKVWVSPDSDFDEQKTDNFKVEADVTPPPPDQGSITLVKNLDILYGGNEGVDDFGLFIGTNLDVASGTTIDYAGGTVVAIGEDGFPGYTQVGGITGDADCADGSVTIVAGQNILCEITNQDQQPSITLIKNVVNGPFGLDDKLPDDFALTVGGNPATSGVAVGVNSNEDIPIDETQVFGFEFVDITGDSKCPLVLGGTVSLDEGEDITCTITNKDVRGEVKVRKFYDLNANGIWDDPPEPLIEDWKVNVDGTDQFTTFLGLYLPGQITVYEYLPIQLNWIATTLTTFTPTVETGERVNVKFGNLCLGPGGGHTLGFWSNKNGQATMNDGGTLAPELALLSGLNLRNGAGADFDPVTYPIFRTWILSATATNMSYMLSAQLAAMELSVEAGNVSDSSLVYAPGLLPFAPITGLSATGFISVNDLMTAANTALGADGYTPAGDPNRAFQGALKNALDAANNNKNFVQTTPCAFSFAE